MAATPTSFESFKSELAAAISWAKDLGLDVSQGRFAEYMRIVTAGGGEKEGEPDSEEFATALTALEAGQELILISKHLNDLPRDLLRDRLRKYIYGTVLEKDEVPQSASSRPRNIGFELVTAATLAAGRLPVILPPVGDVEVRPDPKLNIECKRPQSVKKLKDAIKKGSEPPRVSRGLG